MTVGAALDMTTLPRITTRLWIAATAWLGLGCHPATSEPVAEAPTPAAVDPIADGEPAAEPETQEPAAEAKPVMPVCESASGWRPEKIALPPGFAPSLPSGNELLWFAPGMFEREADDYFTYVFELDFDEAPATDVASLEPLLADYYRGLMNAVAEGSKRTAGDVTVELGKASGGRVSGHITMTDEFTGGAPLDVEIDLEFHGSCVVALVTPDKTEANLAGLAGARACLPCAAKT